MKNNNENFVLTMADGKNIPTLSVKEIIVKTGPHWNGLNSKLFWITSLSKIDGNSSYSHRVFIDKIELINNEYVISDKDFPYQMKLKKTNTWHNI